jgi:hypothetical protein
MGASARLFTVQSVAAAFCAPERRMRCKTRWLIESTSDYRKSSEAIFSIFLPKFKSNCRKPLSLASINMPCAPMSEYP